MSDEDNAIADDADIRVDPGVAAAVHHASVANQIVELLGKQRSRKRQEKEKQRESVS